MDELRSFTFGKGAHATREDGMCLMESVAFLAGEDHSDAPACACPVITKLGVWLNDSCHDALRQELLADLPWRIVGTRSPGAIERQRGYMAADWAVRFVCPIVLRRAGLDAEAQSLESLPVVNDEASADYAADGAARAAARAAAGSACAADYAACAADYAAARAACSACSARAAADLECIQRSFAELLDKMIRLTEPQERLSHAREVSIEPEPQPANA
jgi:hypothetical protein